MTAALNDTFWNIRQVPAPEFERVVIPYENGGLVR